MKKKEIRSVRKKPPAKKMIKKVTSSQIETRDQFTVVLEHLQSDFKMFGEALQFTNNHIVKIEERLDGIDTRLDRMDERFDRIDARLESIEARIEKVELKLAEHDTRIKQLELAITELLKEMRNDTKQKEIEALKIRVATLEALVLNR